MATTTPDRLPVIFCPVCCTPDDAPRWGSDIYVQCTACGTQFRIIELDPTIVAQHSIS